MDAKFDFGREAGQRIAYIRAVDVAELPDALREQAMGREKIYAVHGADGERLALVADRSMAFFLARQNDMAPVSVH